MDFMVREGVNITPEIIFEFNRKNTKDEYLYNRLIVQNGYIYRTLQTKDGHMYQNTQKIDLVLVRDVFSSPQRDITLSEWKKAYKYVLEWNVNIEDYCCISKDLEVLLKKKRYIRAQSSFVRGCTMYNGETCDTFLVFDRIVVHPVVSKRL